jgi:hypothetical protein
MSETSELSVARRKRGMWAIAVLFVGLAAGIIGIAAVQKKYNNGIF